MTKIYYNTMTSKFNLTCDYSQKSVSNIKFDRNITKLTFPNKRDTYFLELEHYIWIREALPNLKRINFDY